RFVVASHTQLGLILKKHLYGCQVVGVGREGPNRHKRRRWPGVSLRSPRQSRGKPGGEVRGMAVIASNVVSPVFTPFEVVVLFLAGVALQAGFGDLLWRFTGECTNFCFIAATFDVRLAGPVARFAALRFSLPTGLGQLGMRGMGETGKLFFVAGLAGLASKKIFGGALGGGRGLGL